MIERCVSPYRSEPLIRQFFAKDYDGAPFKLFGVPHLVALGAIVLIVITLLGIGQGFPVAWCAPARTALATLLVLQELVLHGWRWATGQWSIQEQLPLHLCSVMIWLSAVMLVTQSYSLYEFAYLLGIAGAMQAILTPDAGPYGFPHFRFFQVFVSHGAIIAAAIYMTAVEGYRPVPMSIVRVFLAGNLYMLVVFWINWAIGSNYLFVAHKPDTASLLDALPDWPWYILYIEGIAVLMMWLLYLPFLIHDLSA
jgi:hypothetical integral membrane protein (TIGR02206 family)